MIYNFKIGDIIVETLDKGDTKINHFYQIVDVHKTENGEHIPVYRSIQRKHLSGCSESGTETFVKDHFLNSSNHLPALTWLRNGNVNIVKQRVTFPYKGGRTSQHYARVT